MGKQCYWGRICVYVAFWKVNVVVVGLSNDWNISFQAVVAEEEFFLILSSLLGNKVEDQLLCLPNF